MTLLSRQIWLNFLALLPATALTVLTIAVAFLRFYDEQDFQFLELVAQPRTWSNRLTVAALVVATVNFGVEWDRRNRETDRIGRAEARAEAERAEEEQRRVEEEQRRVEEEQRRVEEQEQATRRARIQNRWIILQIRHQLDPSEQTRAAMRDFLLFLQEYGE